MAFKKVDGAIWKKQTRAGGEMLSITIEGRSLIAFPNEYKKMDKHPDYIIHEKVNEERELTEEDKPF